MTSLLRRLIQIILVTLYIILYIIAVISLFILVLWSVVMVAGPTIAPFRIAMLIWAGLILFSLYSERD